MRYWREYAIAFGIAFIGGVFALGPPRADAQSGTTGPVPIGAGVYGPTLGSNGGHVFFGGGAAPTVNAACGTGAVGPIGTDSAFTLVSGTSTSATCTVTFAAPWKQKPTCLIRSQSGAGPATSPSATGILISGVADSITYNVICIGQPGG